MTTYDRQSYAALATHFKHQSQFAARRAQALVHAEHPQRARAWRRIAHTFRVMARRWGKLAGTLN